MMPSNNCLLLKELGGNVVGTSTTIHLLTEQRLPLSGCAMQPSHVSLQLMELQLQTSTHTYLTEPACQ